jgi:hypothetical protein
LGHVLKFIDKSGLGRWVAGKKHEASYMVFPNDVEKAGRVVGGVRISAGHEHLSDFLVDAQGGHDGIYPFGFGMGKEVFLAESGK